MKINEIFYSLQGEGHFTGTPAVFVRFSGCNQRCSFCDTRHESYEEMTEEAILRSVQCHPARHVVITGGEPALSLTSSLTQLLHREGYFIQMETNGSVRLKEGVEVDWITCSPKQLPVVLSRIDELKVLYMHQDMSQYDRYTASQYRLQPLDSGDAEENKKNLADTINYILQNPKWKLSLQTHKILNLK